MPSVPILFEDDHLLVANKPAGILTLPDRFDSGKANLLHYFSMRYGEIFIVHRLDRDTSGAILLAKDADTHRALNAQFEARTTQKIYQALVDGHPPDSGRISSPIGRDPARPGCMIVARKGKEALTTFRTLERFASCTLLEVRILTGRTHQIRVHLQHIGHPLFVDAQYGRREAFFLSELKKRNYQLGKDRVERPLLSRTSLHASQLQFHHPAHDEPLAVIAPLPKDLRATLQQLRKIAPPLA